MPNELTRRILRIGSDGNAPFAAVLFAGSPENRRALQIRLAEREGALLPLIPPGAGTGRYPLHRLLVERVTSVNTTAAGGNATLMTLTP